MKIIQEANKSIKQQAYINDTKYRYSKYCLKTQYDKFIIIFNYYNDCCIILDNSELKTFKIKNFLIKNWFLVPIEFDEFTLAKETKTKRLLKQKNKPIEKIKTFTILPTTDCNANCAYCFEFGHRKLKMTHKVAEDIVEYICKSMIPNTIIKLRWFGGEPLYNQEVIDIICNGLKNKGIEYSSSMISNGYLVDRKNVKNYKNLWKLKTIQITIDGVDEVYNNVKNYINTDDENHFMTVIENIDYLLQENIYVSTRLNITENNLNDLLDVVDYLFNRFGKRVSVYAIPIYQLTKEENKTVFDNFNVLNKRIISKYGFKKRVKPYIQSNSCMVNSGHAVVINPLGNISLCEHDIDRRVIGNIYTGIDQNSEYIQQYREYLYLDDKCTTCKLYPVCLKTPLCEGDGFCNNYKIEKSLTKQKQILNFTLRRYIKNKEREA